RRLPVRSPRAVSASRYCTSGTLAAPSPRLLFDTPSARCAGTLSYGLSANQGAKSRRRCRRRRVRHSRPRAEPPPAAGQETLTPTVTVGGSTTTLGMSPAVSVWPDAGLKVQVIVVGSGRPRMLCTCSVRVPLSSSFFPKTDPAPALDEQATSVPLP